MACWHSHWISPVQCAACRDFILNLSSFYYDLHITIFPSRDWGVITFVLCINALCIFAWTLPSCKWQCSNVYPVHVKHL
jgi:hypothetical protein